MRRRQNCAAASFEESQSDTIVFARHGQVAQSVERSPEKAGVGGSIPSLATIFSTTYRPPDSRFHSNSFQFQKVHRVLPQGWICASGVVCFALRTPFPKGGKT